MKKKLPKRARLKKMKKALNKASGDLFLIYQKLESYGYLLTRQSSHEEGVTELQGLGQALSEMSEQIHQMWIDTDTATFSQAVKD